MAEVAEAESRIPSFSEILDCIAAWSDRGPLSDVEKQQAEAQLDRCLEALEGMHDGIIPIVRSRIDQLRAALA